LPCHRHDQGYSVSEVKQMSESYEIVTGEQSSNDYPYGRNVCHITFNIEFKQKKGFRFVTQTTNPKNNRVNAPKRSVYSDFMVMIKDEKGHFKPLSFDLLGYGDIDRIVKFLANHTVEFSPEQSRHLWACAINCIRANAMYTRRKFGVSIQDFLQVTRVERMIEMFKDDKDFNDIKTINYNWEELKGLMG